MFQKIQSLNEQADKLELKYWLNHDLFSGHWWFIALINLFFLFLFILFIDKQRIQLITIALLFSFILVGIINELGYYFKWWSYPHQFISPLRTMNAVDFLTVPVIITMIYQFFHDLRFYLSISIIVILALTFIGIPIFVHFDLYRILNWNYFYSFLTLLAISIIVKMFTDLIQSKSKLF